MRFVLSILSAVVSVGATSVDGNWPQVIDSGETIYNDWLVASAEETEVAAPVSSVDECVSTVISIMVGRIGNPLGNVEPVENVFGFLSENEIDNCLTIVAKSLIQEPSLLDQLGEDEHLVDTLAVMDAEARARFVAQKGPTAITCWPWRLRDIYNRSRNVALRRGY